MTLQVNHLIQVMDNGAILLINQSISQSINTA